MKKQVKSFGKFLNESDELSSIGPNIGRGPKVGDKVFAVGFAFDGRELINNYSGYGEIDQVIAPGRYVASFGMDDLECYDSSGTNENAPEIIFFSEKDIVHYQNGVVGVYLHDFLQGQ